MLPIAHPPHSGPCRQLGQLGQQHAAATRPMGHCRRGGRGGSHTRALHHAPEHQQALQGQQLHDAQPPAIQQPFSMGRRAALASFLSVSGLATQAGEMPDVSGVDIGALEVCCG